MITLTEGLAGIRNQIINRLRHNAVSCSNYFAPIHLQPFYVKMFGYKKGDFSITEHISERTIALPFYNNLNEEQIDYIVKELKSAIGEALH